MAPTAKDALPRSELDLRAEWGAQATLLVYAAFAVVAFLALTLCFTLNLEPFTASNRAHRALPLIIILLLSSGFCIWLSRRTSPAIPLRGLQKLQDAPAWTIAALVLVAFFVSAFVAGYVLRGAPVSGDEISYLFQASVFRLGRFWADPSPIQKYLDIFYVYNVQGKLVSQYPPGWAALLACSEMLRLAPWIVNPILGAMTVLALYRLAEQSHDRGTALLAAGIYSVSGFFLLNSASLFNHSLVALSGVVFVIATNSFMRSPRLAAAIGMGLSFSVVAVTRHYDAVLLALPVAALFFRIGAQRHWLRLPMIVLAALPLFGGLLAYYAAVTGSPLQTPQTLVHPYDGLLGPNFSVLRSTEIAFGRGVELAEWVSPLFVVAYLWALMRTAAKGQLRFFDFYGAIFLIGYWLYWGDGGLRWGPRYIYPAFPFMTLTLAAATLDAIRSGDLRMRNKIFVHLSVMSLLVAFTQIPFLVTGAGRVMNEFEDLYDQVGHREIHNAVVLVLSGTGVTWKMPVGGLVRNGVTLGQDVIYAHAGEVLAKQTDPELARTALENLRGFFADRTFWVYRRDDRQVHGDLVPAR